MALSGAGSRRRLSCCFADADSRGRSAFGGRGAPAMPTIPLPPLVCRNTSFKMSHSATVNLAAPTNAVEVFSHKQVFDTLRCATLPLAADFGL
jgi:hypothetical protein